MGRASLPAAGVAVISTGIAASVLAAGALVGLRMLGRTGGMASDS
jgi:hypothetical protein